MSALTVPCSSCCLSSSDLLSLLWRCFHSLGLWAGVPGPCIALWSTGKVLSQGRSELLIPTPQQRLSPSHPSPSLQPTCMLLSLSPPHSHQKSLARCQKPALFQQLGALTQRIPSANVGRTGFVLAAGAGAEGRQRSLCCAFLQPPLTAVATSSWG